MLDIAVIIPAYNSGKYLGEAIESAMGQTLRPAEIVVVDDCSTDGTGELAGAYGGVVELLANERMDKAIRRHSEACPGAGVPKTMKDAAMRAASQYPVVLLIVVVLAVKEYGVTWLLKYFGVG